MRIKAIQPDFWSPASDIIGANTGGIVVNLVWSFWEPTSLNAPCEAGQEGCDGRCFQVDLHFDSVIKTYSAAGLSVTGVAYGVPA
jgi:hypothetical protein